MTSTFLIKASRLIATVTIVVVLVLQIFAGFVDTGRWGFPFLAYPMYEFSHQDGDRIELELSVLLTMDTGEEIPFTAEDMDLSYWPFRSLVTKPILTNNLEDFVDFERYICQRFDNQPVSVRLVDQGLAVSREGLIEGLPKIEVANMAISCPA